MNLRTMFTVPLLAAAMACASSGGGSGSYDRDRLSRAELEAHPTSTLYDVVRNQRPNWLRTQVTGRLNAPQSVGPLIYIDGQPLGEPEVMRSISTTSVESVRFLSASQAQGRYSMQDARPILEITSRGRAP